MKLEKLYHSKFDIQIAAIQLRILFWNRSTIILYPASSILPIMAQKLSFKDSLIFGSSINRDFHITSTGLSQYKGLGLKL